MNAKQNRVDVNLPPLTTAKLASLTNEATAACDSDAAEWPQTVMKSSIRRLSRLLIKWKWQNAACSARAVLTRHEILSPPLFIFNNWGLHFDFGSFLITLEVFARQRKGESLRLQLITDNSVCSSVSEAAMSKKFRAFHSKWNGDHRPMGLHDAGESKAVFF